MVHKFTRVHLFSDLVPVHMNGRPVLLGVILKTENRGLGIERGGKTDGKEKGDNFALQPWER